MQITKEDIAVIKRFNRNVEWLKKARQPEPYIPANVVPAQTWLSVQEAMKFINRSRSWIARITVISANEVDNTGMMLIKGLDWKRETNRIYYKRSSLENLKKGMEKAGEVYDSRLIRNEVV